MQAIVHRHVAFGLRLALLQRFQQRLPRLRLDEVDYCRRATQQRRYCAAGKVIGADVLPYWHLQVDMRVYPAGEHVAARGVELDRAVLFFA